MLVDLPSLLWSSGHPENRELVSLAKGTYWELVVKFQVQEENIFAELLTQTV